MRRRPAVLIAVPATFALSAGTAFAVSAGNFDAALHPVPHDHVAEGGSDVNGRATLRLTGPTLDINLSATGLTPGEPHAMHIHGDTQAANECPGIEVDANTGGPIDPATFTAGTPDGLVSLGEGLPDYGPIDVSLTATGDTSAASGLSLERFLTADERGRIDHHRSVIVPKDVAKNLGNLHSSSTARTFPATLTPAR